MKKYVKILCLLTILSFVMVLCSVAMDKYRLSNNVIRMHVVADSDDSFDQRVKLKVKDAVMAYLSEDMSDISDVRDAMIYLDQHKDDMQAVAIDVLRSEGVRDNVSISLKKEAFPIRRYETFTLPSGVYHSLRINIGRAAGQNWWCVVFPTLCMSAGSGEDMAASVFSDSLNETIHSQNEYEIRFLLLDWLGALENFLFHS